MGWSWFPAITRQAIRSEGIFAVSIASASSSRMRRRSRSFTSTRCAAFARPRVASPFPDSYRRGYPRHQPVRSDTRRRILRPRGVPLLRSLKGGGFRGALPGDPDTEQTSSYSLLGVSARCCWKLGDPLCSAAPLRADGYKSSSTPTGQ